MSFSISGIGTGLDINLIIQQLMQIERRPIYLLENQQDQIQADLSAWETVESKLTSFQQSVDGIEDIFEKMAVTVNDPDVVDVTVTSSATPATYNLEITQLAQSHTIASDTQTDSTSELGYSGTFQIDGVDITVNSTDSLTDIQNTINNTSGIGVTATIVDNQLILKSKETGTANEIQLVDDDITNVLEQLGLVKAGTTSDIKNQLQPAQDAVFKLDGLQITRSSNKITDVIEGVTLELKQEGVSTQFTVDKDIDGMIEEIKSFIDSYNSAADKLNSLFGKNGELQGDLTLNQVYYKLRRNLTDPVETGNSIDQLALIGIEADKYGNVLVDETELRKALEDNFLEVKNLFTAKESTEGYSGIQERLSDYLSMILQTDGPVEGTQEMLQDRINDIDEQIEDLEYRMVLRERNLRQQFLTMEKAVVLMNNQMAWLQAQMSDMLRFSVFNPE